MIERWGWLRGSYYYLMRALGKYCGLVVCHLFARPILLPDSGTDLGPGREIRILTKEQLLAFSDDPALQMDKAFIETADSRGDACCGVLEEGRLVAYVWRTFVATAHGDELFVDFNEKCRYGYKSLTLPAYRGQRLQILISEYTDKYLTRGRQFHIFFVETHNFPSIVAVKKEDAVVVGHAGYWKLFGRYFCFRSTGAARYGFRFFVP
ncbi:hypothetical protein F0M18_10745 [Pseudohalioglobus sediminis]|uniref:N-acetyltransferase domain-containing protein n=1 Tax=Pseudohalioglobus sediminis TaxID=2606449 RepID=A0A5B0WY84_9GAMM|nr:hypothetical protein [Pseudohalioglobus sediminis]KAA1191990.1 hypothetical protein F0M18_10745 [Pseudohalioglobus sediminis]